MMPEPVAATAVEAATTPDARPARRCVVTAASARPRPPLGGGTRAKQCAAIVLAVLSGDCSLAEASRRFGVSLTRYYGLERQALQGLVLALESPNEQRRDGGDQSPARAAGTRSAAAASAGARDAARGGAAGAAEDPKRRTAGRGRAK